MDSKNRKKHVKLLDKYGISLTDYNDMLKRQDNRCGLCFRHFGPTRNTKPVVDHDHRTLIVRGILHSRCNLLLGHAGDDTSLLQRAVAYLNKSRDEYNENT